MTTGLIILDGYGQAIDPKRSAIDQAETPFMDSLFAQYPHTLLAASGQAVGLPEGQMGNSEVGHLNIGAGRVVYQELTRITKEIQEGGFYENPVLTEAMDWAKGSGKRLHIIGLLSDGGVHSHINHLFALLEMAQKRGLDDVSVHAFLDGRDVPPKSGIGYLEQLQSHLLAMNFGTLTTVVGRYYAMDRDNRWERVQLAYDALTKGSGQASNDVLAAMAQRYAAGETDEFIQPVILSDQQIQDGDSVIFFNFRPDRARQLTRALTEPVFDGFARSVFPQVHFVCMTQYDKTFTRVQLAYQPQKLVNTLGEYLSSLGKTQLRIAETEKYAHVTFFFNGGVEKPNPGEARTLVHSPKVATYDLQPEMSAPEVSARAAEECGDYDVMILNFANPDMVGHTGVMSAAIAAVEAVDTCLKRVVEAILATGGKCMITADHGNADIMVDEQGKPMTAHTTNLVPLIVVDSTVKAVKDGGKLCDLAPTLLDLMGLVQPKEMTGHSLLEK